MPTRNLVLALLVAVPFFSCGGEIAGGDFDDPGKRDKPIVQDGGTGGGGGGGGTGGGTEEPKGVGTAELSWVAPTTNEDNSKLTDLAGYRVYYRLPGATAKSIDVGNVTTYTMKNLPSGTVEFWVTALNEAGNESKPTPTKSKTFP